MKLIQRSQFIGLSVAKLRFAASASRAPEPAHMRLFFGAGVKDASTRRFGAVLLNDTRSRTSAYSANVQITSIGFREIAGTVASAAG